MLQCYQVLSPKHKPSPWETLESPTGDLLKMSVEIRDTGGVYKGIASPKTRREGRNVEERVEEAVARLLVPATHDLHEGFFDRSSAVRLKASLTGLPEGIRFAPFGEGLKPYLEGGTCSAMALCFMSKYFELAVKGETEVSRDLLMTLARSFRTSHPVFRHIQAVLNQLEVDPALALDENRCQEHKIQALARFIHAHA